MDHSEHAEEHLDSEVAVVRDLRTGKEGKRTTCAVLEHARDMYLHALQGLTAFWLRETKKGLLMDRGRCRTVEGGCDGL